MSARPSSVHSAAASSGGAAAGYRSGGAGPASIAMAELLAIHRTPARGARPQRWGTLATGFGANEPIRPAGAATSRPDDVRRAPWPTTPNTADTPDTPNTPDTANASGTYGMRTYLPAPPPVSLGRAAAPPVPAAARDTSSSGLMTMGAAGPRSLVSSTAAAFEELEANARYARHDMQNKAGSQMTEILPPLSMSQSAELVSPGDVTVIEVSMLDDAAQLNQLVDEVVDRIERRVVDELERRGRRYTPGAF